MQHNITPNSTEMSFNRWLLQSSSSYGNFRASVGYEIYDNLSCQAGYTFKFTY